jgi:hypothetical protein
VTKVPEVRTFDGEATASPRERLKASGRRE